MQNFGGTIVAESYERRIKYEEIIWSGPNKEKFAFLISRELDWLGLGLEKDAIPVCLLMFWAEDGPSDVGLTCCTAVSDYALRDLDREILSLMSWTDFVDGDTIFDSL